MLVDYGLKIAFVHIPRCAGLSITTALAPFVKHGVVDTHTRRHERAILMRGNSPEWDEIKMFAVIRSAWEIVASDYRLTRHCVEGGHTGGPPDWQGRLSRFRRGDSLDNFCIREYLDNNRFHGFWPTWCLDENGREIGVRAVRYELLAETWPETCEWLGLPGAPQLPRLNRSPAFDDAKFTVPVAKELGSQCRADVHRFGFACPEELIW